MTIHSAGLDEAVARAQAEMSERLRRLREQSILDALHGSTTSSRSDTFNLHTMRAEPPRKPSRYSGVEVVDLERDAAGVWRVPAEMLPFVRAL